MKVELFLEEKTYNVYKVFLEADMYKKFCDDEAIQLVPRYSKPGFRRGKVPVSVIVKDCKADLFDSFVDQQKKEIIGAVEKDLPFERVQSYIAMKTVDKEPEVVVISEKKPNIVLPDFSSDDFVHHVLEPSEQNKKNFIKEFLRFVCAADVSKETEIQSNHILKIDLSAMIKDDNGDDQKFDDVSFFLTVDLSCDDLYSRFFKDAILGKKINHEITHDQLSDEMLKHLAISEDNQKKIHSYVSRVVAVYEESREGEEVFYDKLKKMLSSLSKIVLDGINHKGDESKNTEDEEKRLTDDQVNDLIIAYCQSELIRMNLSSSYLEQMNSVFFPPSMMHDTINDFNFLMHKDVQDTATLSDYENFLLNVLAHKKYTAIEIREKYQIPLDSEKFSLYCLLHFFEVYGQSSRKITKEVQQQFMKFKSTDFVLDSFVYNELPTLIKTKKQHTVSSFMTEIRDVAVSHIFTQSSIVANLIALSLFAGEAIYKKSSV